MTTYTVEGTKPYMMTVRETGEVKEGLTVFCSYMDEKITGKGMEKFSISDEKLEGEDIKPGDSIQVVYNKYGKVDGIILV